MRKEINLAPLWQLQNRASYDPARDAACKAAVQAELDEQQRRCRERILTVDMIFGTLRAVEDHLGIPKKDLEGTRIMCDPFAQKFPSSYKGIPMTTEFQAYYKNGSWRLTDVCRMRCTSGHRVQIVMSDSAQAALIYRMSNYS